MTLKMDKNRLLIFVFIALAGIPVCMLGNSTVGLLFSLFIFAVIFYEAKFSFFTIISFLLVFTFLQVWVQDLYGNAYGMIQNAHYKIPLYVSIHLTCMLTFFDTLLFFIFFTDIIKNEKRIYCKKITLNSVTTVVFILAAIILVIALFPSVPNFVLSNRRTQGISGTYGFVVVCLLLTSLTVDTSFEHKQLWVAYVFIVFWFLGHGERVDVLGFVSYFILKLFNRNNDKNEGQRHKDGMKDFLKRFKLYIILFIFLMFCIWIGVYRTGNGSKFNFFDILQKMFVQATAGDVVYVYECSVDMWMKGNLTHGITYLDWLAQFIPGASTPYMAGVYIRQYYFTMGGGFFFFEPMMNFGMVGVLVTNIVFCCWYWFVTKKPSIIRCMAFIPMVIEVFRTAWYGRGAWILASCIEVPMLYLLIKYFLNNVRVSRVIK